MYLCGGLKGCVGIAPFNKRYARQKPLLDHRYSHPRLSWQQNRLRTFRQCLVGTTLGEAREKNLDKNMWALPAVFGRKNMRGWCQIEY